MAEPPLNSLPVRIDEWQMRTIFNEGRYWERVQTGELTMRINRDTHPTRTKAKEPYCTRTQEISILDANGFELARAHRYVRPDGEIGASGKPDPRRAFKDGVMYRLQKKPKTRLAKIKEWFRKTFNLVA